MDLVVEFFHAIKIEIPRKNEAYLLHHLRGDIKFLSRENSLDPMIANTTILKKKKIEEFGDEIGLFPTGRYSIAHNPTVNPPSIVLLHCKFIA